MQTHLCLLSCLAVLSLLPVRAIRADPDNPQIDMPAFLRDAQKVAGIREERRIDEAAFARAMREPGAVLLDARSAERFRELHMEGAVNLPFTEFTEANLARVLPSKDTPVLIYCNNNFRGDPVAFAFKSPPASLNLSTFVALQSYGYVNVRELRGVLDVKNATIPLAGTRAPRTDGAPR